MFHYATDSVTGNTAAYARETCDGLIAAGSRCTFVEQAGSGHTVGLGASGTRWTSNIGPFLWDELDLEHATNTTTTTTTTTTTGPCAPDVVPFADANALVRQQYLDLRDREPTSSESASAASAVTTCQTTADQLIVSLIAGGQTTTDARLVRLYHAYFRRAPDPSGLSYWSRKLASGRGLIVVAQEFATSSEFRSTYGSLSNTQFVNLVYGNVLGRPADASGRAFWVRRLDNGTSSRGAVMASFSESSENVRTKTPLVTVWRAIRGMRNATPTTAELRALTDPILAGDASVLDAVHTIRLSPTYAARF